MVSVQVESSEIARASLHVALPWYTHIYTIPFLSLYPLLAYAYYVRYDDWIKSEEWTFLACVSLGAGHALSFLVTRWSAGAKAWITTRKAASIEDADCIRLVPHQHRGEGEIVSLIKRIPSEPMSYTFNYQRDTYVVAKSSPILFTRLPYPSSHRPPLSEFLAPAGLASKQTEGLTSLYGKNEFNIPIPSFSELFGEHATAPFFVFQIFCVALWCLDEYWYYSIFTLFMLVMFECTVVWQRLKTLTEFRTMSVAPYPIQCLRDSKWTTLQTDELLPGDVVSVARLQTETVVPADILLVHGTCIVNEAMLSGESTPLLKESIQLLESSDKIDVDSAHKNAVLFSGTKVLQASPTSDFDKLRLIDVKDSGKQTTLCLAAAQALVRLDDGTIVGDPMEKTTLEALEWQISQGDSVAPSSSKAPNASRLYIRRRFQFSSALKRMSSVSSLPSGKALVAVKGAPETIKGMLGQVPEWYDETYKWYTRRGSRVLALGSKEMDSMSIDKINKLPREDVESNLAFAGFLVFHCPLKADAVETLKMLADSSHRCVMITGDNPLTAVHVARDVEIVDRDALILDLKENPAHEADLCWRTVDETKIISVDPSKPLDTSLFDQYDICITGAAMKQFQSSPSWNDLVQNTWVYARVSPAQKEFILTSLKTLGYVTLMAGDGTNDVGALKQAHIGVALLDGSPEDLQKIAEHQKLERIKKVYESQLKISARFGQVPPPVPPAIAHFYPDVVEAQKKAAADLQTARKKNPMEKFDMASITDAMANMEGDEDVPQIKLGDASCAAPFTSKLSHVAAITHIIRQGRCTLVATIQMYKILALNCLITAYSLSVQYLDGIKFGDYQVTVSGMLMSVCFLCISRAQPVEKLSRERPLGNIFNLYVLLSVLIQFALHIISLVYITNLSHTYEPPGIIDLDAKFEPSLLNTAIYLLGLSQQVSTFAINFQGRPFREGIRENSKLYWGLVGASAVAFSGATDLMPELNRWLQIVEMESLFKVKLTSVMIADFLGCWVVEKLCKHLFADLEPKPLITRGRERREARRLEEAKQAELAAVEKKDQ
ncbi:hypothetical protein HYDPIDRAFT_136644 [Hydnomerulius pinastri MD-312]|uniref:Cation-transporting ATPase n=1 Tax=Hydnomerulius pinastri MD-312 TaxID=994086 RepID=A0A0C9VVJ7_9AGAM|nr:hypothetical protein HYDPIDRAFT_136644 [Hydnomerulius pinastri MD-312]